MIQDESSVSALSKKRKNHQVKLSKGETSTQYQSVQKDDACQADVVDVLVHIEEQMKEALEGLGIPVGPRTSRECLLQLLDRHVTKKRTRLSDTTPATIHPCSSLFCPRSKSLALEPMSQEDTTHIAKVNYEGFEEKELEKMLRDLGLDPTGMDKSHLVETCKFYEDLSESHISWVT